MRSNWVTNLGSPSAERLNALDFQQRNLTEYGLNCRAPQRVQTSHCVQQLVEAWNRCDRLRHRATEDRIAGGLEEHA